LQQEAGLKTWQIPWLSVGARYFAMYCSQRIIISHSLRLRRVANLVIRFADLQAVGRSIGFGSGRAAQLDSHIAEHFGVREHIDSSLQLLGTLICCTPTRLFTRLGARVRQIVGQPIVRPVIASSLLRAAGVVSS
jgi:hypothetical protein